MSTFIAPNTSIIQMIGNIRNQPSDRNFLSPLAYNFIFTRTPNLVYFLQRIAVPGITLGEVAQATPWASIPLGGDHIQYQSLPLTFKVDVEMLTYQEILKWMQGLGEPENFGQGLAVNDPSVQDIGFGRRSDGLLQIKNPESQVEKYFYFRDMIPLQLSELIFDTTDEGQQYIECSAIFQYSFFLMVSNPSDLASTDPSVQGLNLPLGR